MIQSFRCKETQKIWQEQHSRKLPGSIQQKALQKLQMINAAVTLQTLGITPGNRLEALRGNRVGQYSIRINDQWRICFQWRDGHCYDVEIVDYH